MNTTNDLIMKESKTLVDIIGRRAIEQPGERIFTFLPDGEEREETLTYSEFDYKARQIASLLMNKNRPGDRVLLLLQPGLDFITAFAGCLYSGVIAVPAYPPRVRKPDQRLSAIIASSGAKTALTCPDVHKNSETIARQTEVFAGLEYINTAEITGEAKNAAAFPGIGPDHIAFLQYTSGSTSKPKGVKVSQANLMHNLASIYKTFGHSSQSKGVIWLPPYHDMGLIGGILQPLFAGFPVVLMSPRAFLQSPLRWLKAISSYGATTSGGPNFAYDLCVKKISEEQKAGLDLSSWEVAFNGAEPICEETLNAFEKAFKSCGFKKEAFFPCYGLAEGTLMVSGAEKHKTPGVYAFQKEALKKHTVITAGEKDPASRQLVGNGLSMEGQEIKIVDPVCLNICSSEEIGEIWVAGPSVARGYWELEKETLETFCAFTSDTNEGPFLRTGDLGFFHKGQLFVTGRRKDLIIIRGRNYYPQDIEISASKSHPALQENGGAAFSVETGTGEELVIVFELSRIGRQAHIEEVSRAIRQAAAREHELQVYAVVLLRPGHLPRTSSGKVRRQFCKESFLEGSLETAGSSILGEQAKTDKKEGEIKKIDLKKLSGLPEKEQKSRIKTFLQARLENLLRMKLDKNQLDEPLISLGLDSLSAVELQTFIAAEFNCTVSFEEFLGELTLGGLTDKILSGFNVSGRDSRPSPVSDFIKPDHTGPIPLSADQELLWLVDQLNPGTTVYNLPGAIRLTGRLDINILEQALNELIERQESLRTSFTARKGKARQIINSPSAIKLPLLDLTAYEEEKKQQAEFQKAVNRELTTPFNLTESPLLRVKLIKESETSHVLLVTFHHIISDLWSLYLFNNELQELYRAHNSRTAPVLPGLDFTYADFAAVQKEQLNRGGFEKELAYWKKKLAGATPLFDLPTDYPRPEKQSREGTSFSFSLSKELYRSLLDFCRKNGVTLYMTLLTAFGALLYKYSSRQDFIIGSPFAGRRKEFENLIGFFAFPIMQRFRINDGLSFKDLLDSVRKTMLEGFDFPVPLAELLKNVCPKKNKQYHPLYQVSFGYFNKPVEKKKNEKNSDLDFSLMDIGKETTDFDLFLTMYNEKDGVKGVLEYCTALFSGETVKELMDMYCSVLANMAENPGLALADVDLTKKLGEKAEAAKERERKEKLVVSAAFTSEPLEEPLKFWLKKMGWDMEIEFAPYNQVFQQLTDPAGLISLNSKGANIILFRFEDWFRYSDHIDQEKVKKNVQDVITYIGSSARHSSVPYIVCICPASPDTLGDESMAHFFEQMEENLFEKLQKTAGVYPITSKQLLSTYPVADYYSPYTDREGHVPYTPVLFTALAMMISRKLYGLRTKPKKVIVLDCDNTLWSGVCGEDGAEGVEINSHRKTLQDFMINQKESGRLLCLASKNNEKAVWDVFDRPDKMPLKKEHLVAWKINWQAKSQNLHELAGELNLGLDSFIFVDDNPVECAEVKANCPGVEVLLLPGETAKIPAFLKHVWPFDIHKVTDEDRKRTLLYQQNSKREQFKKSASGFLHFIKGLKLDITIRDIDQEQVERVSQLTQRTNQFNFTTIRRNETALLELVQKETFGGVAVNVKDRFGDYGLVGVMLFEKKEDVLKTDTFLLSCRSMGRGVEYKMMAHLFSAAADSGLKTVEIPFFASGKNQPALNFLNKIGEDFRKPYNEGYIFSFPVEYGPKITFS